jgi:transposase InsO family protein
MSGKWITGHQIRLYMYSKQNGKSKKAAAAQAAFSERSAYNVENKPFKSPLKKDRWKTRPDPFEAVWQSELLPLLSISPKLEARTLLEYLQRRYDGQYPDKVLRTLQRRVKQWKAVSGPEKEIIFRQNHPPGWQGISDFTFADTLGVTIRKEVLHHLLYHYRLSYSGVEFVQVVQGGESFSALAEGMQNAFWTTGGVPETHRTDSLSAAYKNCSDKNREEFTQAYTELCKHYRIEPTRNNKGIAHENGSIESPNGHLKNRLDQALMLRGSRDFDSLDEYRTFVREIVTRYNRRIEKAFVEERAFLKPLPERKACDYTEERIRVTSSSTIAVKKVTYSVPSRLIGMIVKVHLYDDRLECYVGGDHVATIQRLRKHKKCHYIDYRHVIGTLVRKPQAFRNYIYRDQMFPTFAFRQTWEQLDRELDSRKACQEYVKILYEGARSGGEELVNKYLEDCLSTGVLAESDKVKALFKAHKIQPPELKNIRCELADYDVLLVSLQGGAI